MNDDKRYTEDPRVKGEIAEHLFIIKCLELRIDITKPLNQNPRYDFLVKLKSGWKKVQIKYVSLYDNKICVSKVKRQSGNRKALIYNDDEIDYMFAYNPETNSWYNIPFKETTNIVVLRIDEAKGKQANNKTVRKAEDYILNLDTLN